MASDAPVLQHAIISFPNPAILLVTLNRPSTLNCINHRGHHELHELFEWMDENPKLRCGIITGIGRAFCVGADLKEWSEQISKGEEPSLPVSGFGGLSRRTGKKPIIAAINGLCLGGGCEMIINADLVIASRAATFALPEVRRGVLARAGALPRLVRTVGRQRAMDMVLTGRSVSASEAAQWGLVNKVVDSEGDGMDSGVVKEAISMAEEIIAGSPDSVIISRIGISLGWEGIGAEEASRKVEEDWYPAMNHGENMAEGVLAFVEKRKPRWVPSKL